MSMPHGGTKNRQCGEGGPESRAIFVLFGVSFMACLIKEARKAADYGAVKPRWMSATSVLAPEVTPARRCWR
jgi:hypothetical protein